MSNEKELNLIIASNLNKYLSSRNITQMDLADYMKVSQTTVSNWCNGIKMPRMNKIDKICEYLNIKRSDLMELSSNKTSNRANRINVLGSVPAGVPLEAIEDIVDFEDIPEEWLTGSREYFGLKIKGDSMYPKYIDGDTIIVRKQPNCESGQDAVVYVNGYDATLKRVIKQQFGIMLQPLNPDFEPKIYDYNDELNPVTILGVVVEIRRKV
jgi:repressor LexA